jgi:hypothetical protein
MTSSLATLQDLNAVSTESNGTDCTEVDEANGAIKAISRPMRRSSRLRQTLSCRKSDVARFAVRFATSSLAAIFGVLMVVQSLTLVSERQK